MSSRRSPMPWAMSPTERTPHFELRVPAEAGHLATVRLFCATIARTLGADEEVVEDLKLAISEVVTAIVVNAKTDHVHVEADAHNESLHLVLGPVTADDLVDGSIDPIDVVLAVFPEAERRAESSTVMIPVPLSNGAHPSEDAS